MSCLFFQPRTKWTLIQKQPSLKRNDTRAKTWRNISVSKGGENWNRFIFTSNFRCTNIVFSVDFTALLSVIKPQWIHPTQLFVWADTAAHCTGGINVSVSLCTRYVQLMGADTAALCTRNINVFFGVWAHYVRLVWAQCPSAPMSPGCVFLHTIWCYYSDAPQLTTESRCSLCLFWHLKSSLC